MTARRPLPLELGGLSFSVREARDLRVSAGRLRAGDLERPFRGIRTFRPIDDVFGAVEALHPRLTRHHAFSHVTAARMFGFPMPTRWHPGEAVFVTSVGARGTIRAVGVRGFETEDYSLPVTMFASMPVVAPADTWTQLATLGPREGFTRERLTAVADYLISGRRGDHGRESPLCSLEDLAAAVSRHGSRRGAVALAWALEHARAPVDSPKETELRLALIAAGLPEPVPNLAVATRSRLIHLDLAYPEVLVGLEYLGDAHRTDARRWRRDLTRVQDLQALGWVVVLVAADDLWPDTGPLVARVRAMVRARSQTAR